MPKTRPASPPEFRERIVALARAGRGVRPILRDRRLRDANDLVDRNLFAPTPNQLRVGDITCVPPRSGFIYPAVVVDAFSRVRHGLEPVAAHASPSAGRWGDLRTRIVLDALKPALTQRRPTGVIHHSDSQKTVAGFRAVWLKHRSTAGHAGAARRLGAA